MTSFGKDLIESANEALAIAKRERTAARIVDVKITDIAALRQRLGLSQDAFAQTFGLSVATLRDWEQGRRSMDRTARAFLKVIEQDPEMVARALRAA